MKIKNIAMYIIIVIIIISLFLVFNKLNIIDYNNTNNNTTTVSINNTNISNINASLNIIDYNSTLTIPPNDFVIDSINWNLYPNLEPGYIYMVSILDPTDYVPHKFIEVQILTEIKNTKDKEIIRKQLTSVAYEARRIYGINSDIHILGTEGGAAAWDVSIAPYENDTY